MASRKNFMGTGPSAQEQQARRESVEALFTPRLAQRRVASQDVAIARIQSNPFQARTSFDATELEELAQAIRELGFTSRLRVRPHPQQEGVFQLVYGERRLRAAALAELETVPCDIAEHTDDDLIEIGLAENIQRRDLNPIEEANAFQHFIDQRGYSIRRLAERIGKDKSYLEGRLALLRAPDDVQTLVAQRPDTLDAARQISKLPLDERQPIITALIEGTMTSRDVRAFVRSVQSIPPTDPTATDAATRVTSTPKTASATSPTPAQEPNPTTTPPPPARADRTPDPYASLVRSVQRDRQAISAILKRWQILRTGGAAQQAIIDEVLEAVLIQISTMTTMVEAVEESL
ncbi:MAG: ParB/RepB/Spo0J family partition protein [bacterium]|nr:ParB/RepB/Spo0J family partition protein [bacterium]